MIHDHTFVSVSVKCWTDAKFIVYIFIGNRCF